MVYARRYPIRYRRYRKRYYKRSNQTNWTSVAKKAFTMGKIALGLLNTEKKFFDVTTSGNTSTSGVVIPLTSPIARGTTESDRTGGSILLKNDLLRFNVYYNGGPVERVRLMMVMDTQDANGTAPTFADILQDTSANQSVLSPLNMSNAGRFKILFDKAFTLNSSRPSLTVDKWFSFQMDKNNIGVRTVGQHAKWDILDNIESGHVYLFYVGSNNTTPTAYRCYNRLRYIDN